MVNFIGNYETTERSDFTEITVSPNNILVVRLTQEGETFENYLFDITNSGADVTITPYPSRDNLLNNFTIRNIGIRGEAPQSADYMMTAACHNEGLIENVYIADGSSTYPVSSNHNNHPGGVWGPPENTGRVTFRWVYAANWVNRALNLSAGSDGNGDYTVEHSFIVDSQIAGIELSGTVDIVRDCYLRARSQDHRTIWVSGSSADVFLGGSEVVGPIRVDSGSVIGVENTSHQNISGNWSDLGGNDTNPELRVPGETPSTAEEAARGETTSDTPVRDDYDHMLYVDVQDYDEFVNYELRTSGTLVEAAHGSTRIDASTSVSQEGEEWVGTGQTENYDDSWYFNGGLRSLTSTPENTGAEFRLNGNVITPDNWEQDLLVEIDSPNSIPSGGTASFDYDITNQRDSARVVQAGLDIDGSSYREDLEIPANSSESHTFTHSISSTGDYDWTAFAAGQESSGTLTVFQDDTPDVEGAIGYVRAELGSGPENVPVFPVNDVQYPCVRLRDDGTTGALKIAKRGDADYPELSFETTGGVYGVNSTGERSDDPEPTEWMDNFEHDNLSGHYDGNNQNFELFENSVNGESYVWEGDHTLRLKEEYVGGVLTSSGLHQTAPEKGDTIEVFLWMTDSTSNAQRAGGKTEEAFRFGVYNNQFLECSLRLDFGAIQIRERHPNVNTASAIHTLAEETGYSWAGAKWIKMVIRWGDNITFQLVDAETEETLTNRIVGVPEHHDATNARFGIRKYARTGLSLYTDGVRIT